MSIILKMGVRVLRPIEFNLLLEHIPKMQHKLLVKALLYSGCRFRELKRIKDNPSWYNQDSGYIYLPPSACLKVKAKQRERYIKLSSVGKEVIQFFLTDKHPISTRMSLNESLNRWAKNSKLNSEGLCLKTFRKSWESWLLATYPNRILEVCLSQGHTQLTSLQHYIQLGFSDSDKEQMKPYVSGW